MKTLHYRRHSLKDGAVKDTIGPKGLVLASREGMLAFNRANYDKLFHGPLVRTAQTALAFLEAFIELPKTMPVILEIGEESTFGENGIGTKAFRERVAAGDSFLEAVRNAHGDGQAKQLAETAMKGVSKMFAQMADGEWAIAFGHSPVIDLVVWYLDCFSEGKIRLKELEGVVITYDENGYHLDGMITVQPLE